MLWPTDVDEACCVDADVDYLFRLLKVSNVLYRCGSRIEEPSGVNVNASLQSPSLYGQSPWGPSTTVIPRPQLGLVRPTAVWTRRGMGVAHYRITCPYRAMHLLCTCIIHYHPIGSRQGHHHQTPLRTAPKSVAWQRQAPEWGGRPLRIQTSPFRSMVLRSNFHLSPTFRNNAQITHQVMVPLAPWRHKRSVMNASLRYSVLSGIPRASLRCGWRPRSTR